LKQKHKCFFLFFLYRECRAAANLQKQFLQFTFFFKMFDISCKMLRKGKTVFSRRQCADWRKAENKSAQRGWCAIDGLTGYQGKAQRSSAQPIQIHQFQQRIIPIQSSESSVSVAPLRCRAHPNKNCLSILSRRPCSKKTRFIASSGRNSGESKLLTSS
jgi:hypothetical protein